MSKTHEENLQNCPQAVTFTGHDDLNSVELYSKKVSVIASPNGIDHGSSKVKLKNIVDFTWDSHYYTGQLLAVHVSGKYLAYGIKSSQGKEIQDLAFAHVKNAILACVDQIGNLFVHTIVSSTSQLVCNLLLSVVAEGSSPMTHRVIWCPYIPEEEHNEAEDVSKLLIVTRGSKAELWQVDYVYAQLGTAIATASLDGKVKFFQVNIHGVTLEKPNCLHQWKPHDGRPICSLFFLDDHKNTQPEAQFWRFSVTGCDNNSEIKIWSCEKWTCLQTINFQVSPLSNIEPVLKAGLDLAAGYLLLSDISNKALYILSLSKDIADGSDSIAYVSTISEFRLPYPILSFGIVDAGIRKVRPTGESLEDLCPCDDESEDQLVIRMYLVQPKSLQECHIAFQPARQVKNACMMDTLTHDSLIGSDDLQNTRHENNDNNENQSVGDRSSSINESVAATIEAAMNNASLNLMTPDAFSSPAKKENNTSSSTSPELGNVLSASPSIIQVVQALNAIDTPLATSEIEQAPASGGSSPSREVREIFSLAEPEDEEEEEEDLKQIDSDHENNENWSYHPIALLSDVHVIPNDIKNDNKKCEKIVDNSKIDPAWITTITQKLDKIMSTIEDQKDSIKDLQKDMSRYKQETPILSRIESALSRASQQQLSVIEKSLYNRQNHQSELFTTIELAVADNIKKILPKIVNDAVEPIKKQIQINAENNDDLLKENLTKLIGSSYIKDTIRIAVVEAAKPALDISFREAFETLLLPGIEKACQTMFRQIQDAFSNGTQEYIQYIDTVLERACQKRNEQETETLSYMVREELRSGMIKGFGPLQEGVLRSIKESIRDNLGQQLIDIQARSRATTPGLSVPNTAEAQVRILSLVQRGQYNTAFQQALNASDLSLVVYVCEKTEPSRVFSTDNAHNRCCLQQPVILSLVQQLSADLTHRTDLKHKWLEEAILNLNPMDPVTREHMGTVLMKLETQLSSFIATNPTHRSVKSMKMLSMAAKALFLNQHT
ncbi:hypothetical protein HCN44_009794 [Aphidius gifuensis]|uniref:Enhancer of mRNA-decapping protein 4 n=1 Tax=Aphidius gifuensis TaxID=684658 RepID=A0A834Y4F4_APHGI|nr:hypothetical protein HCN44_009794 [Aphidius gifuensis]